MSVVRKSSPSQNAYSLPHCRYIAVAADMHIISITLFPTSEDIFGTGMPWIETTNFSKVSVLFSRISLYNFGRINSKSSWLLLSTQLRNGNVTWWLKNAKNSSVIKSSLGRYILQESINWFVLATSSSNIVNISLAWSIDVAAFPSLAHVLCWYTNTHLDTFSHSQMWSNRTACEQDFADLLYVISASMASIPASTRAVLPSKEWF